LIVQNHRLIINKKVSLGLIII